MGEKMNVDNWPNRVLGTALEAQKNQGKRGSMQRMAKVGLLELMYEKAAFRSVKGELT